MIAKDFRDGHVQYNFERPDQGGAAWPSLAAGGELKQRRKRDHLRLRLGGAVAKLQINWMRGLGVGKQALQRVANASPIPDRRFPRRSALEQHKQPDVITSMAPSSRSTRR
jgi:hypothetical protein